MLPEPGSPADMAASAAGRSRSGGPGPPEAGRSPVRSGVLRQLRAHPAAGGSHRPGPAWYRHSDAVSHHRTQRGSSSLEASAEADLTPALRPDQAIAPLSARRTIGSAPEESSPSSSPPERSRHRCCPSFSPSRSAPVSRRTRARRRSRLPARPTAWRPVELRARGRVRDTTSTRGQSCLRIDRMLLRAGEMRLRRAKQVVAAHATDRRGRADRRPGSDRVAGSRLGVPPRQGRPEPVQEASDRTTAPLDNQPTTQRESTFKVEEIAAEHRDQR